MAVLEGLVSAVTSTLHATSRARRSVARSRWFGAALVAISLPAAMLAGPGPASSAADSTGRYIVVLKESVGNPSATATRQGDRLGFDPKQVYSHALPGYLASISSSDATDLRSDPSVALVTKDRPFTRVSKPDTVNCQESSPLVRQCLDNWADRIDAESSSARSGDGRGAVNLNVGVIDSGIDAAHPDLNVAGGVDCSGGQPVPVTPTDPIGHGTFVGGVIGARDNRIGVVGVAPGARLWSVNVADASGAVGVSAVVCAVDWVTATRQDQDPRNDISVANFSLGASGSDDHRCGLTVADPVHLAICRSVAAGVAYAVAAGNEGGDLARAVPASYNEVLSATAIADFDGRPGGRAAATCLGVDESARYQDDQVAFFSNYAGLPEDWTHSLAAPGVCVSSTFPGGYAVGSGTSVSTPVVAGTVALCIRFGPCSDGHARATMATILSQDAAYNSAHPRYGFRGDPLRPLTSRYYGPLLNAGVY